MRVSVLGRATLALGLIAGCSPQPSTAPPPPSGALTTPAPSSAASLGISWARYLRLGGMVDMVHASKGWVALGECERGSCVTTATVWHSPDLEAWETIELPRSGDIVPVALSANEADYFIAAYDYDDVGSHDDAFLQVWRSSEGRFWDRFGELRLGACDNDDCPIVRGVGRAPNGSIVVGAVIQDDNDPGQAYFSDDANTWRPLTIATFSNGVDLDRIDVQGVEPTANDLFLVGKACAEACAMTVWSTRDGEHWAEEQGFGVDVDHVSVASDEAQRVVAASTCQTATECTTDVWTGVRSTVWANVLPAIDLADPEVVWTGAEFVLVGLRDGGFTSYVSPDGLAWTEVPGNPLDVQTGCGALWLAGGGTTVMFGVPQCALWQGTVERAR